MKYTLLVLCAICLYGMIPIIEHPACGLQLKMVGICDTVPTHVHWKGEGLLYVLGEWEDTTVFSPTEPMQWVNASRCTFWMSEECVLFEKKLESGGLYDVTVEATAIHRKSN